MNRKNTNIGSHVEINLSYWRETSVHISFPLFSQRESFVLAVANFIYIAALETSKCTKRLRYVVPINKHVNDMHVLFLDYLTKTFKLCQ
jgi:hypothetical protein